MRDENNEQPGTADEDDEEDDFETFGYEMPKCAGYLVQRIDACSNCRFGDPDPEGGCYCKLYVQGIDKGGVIRQCHFMMVEENGRCRHYKPEQDHYRLGGCGAMDWMNLVFGRSRKKEDREPRFSARGVLKGLQQLADREENGR